ncbi:hypothetical protein ACVXG8_20110 [Escherichia coli]
MRKEFVDDNRGERRIMTGIRQRFVGRCEYTRAGIKASFSSTLSGHLGRGV